MQTLKAEMRKDLRRVACAIHEGMKGDLTNPWLGNLTKLSPVPTDALPVGARRVPLLMVQHSRARRNNQ